MRRRGAADHAGIGGRAFLNRIFGGGSKSNVTTTTTVDNQVAVTNETTNNLDLAVTVAPEIVNQVDLSPIERMGEAIVKAGNDNAAALSSALETQARAIAGGLAVLGAGQAAVAEATKDDGRGFADAVKTAGGVATAALALLALYWAVTRGRAPNIEVGG